MASNIDDTIANVREKLEKEKVILNSITTMRNSTSNRDVLDSLEVKQRDSRRNLEYFQKTLADLEMKKMGSGMHNMTLDAGASRKAGNPLTPPPKDGWNGYMGQPQSAYGDSQGPHSHLSGGSGLMPQSGPFTPGVPNAQTKRAQYTKLELLKYDTNLMGPRIQFMLSQLNFKRTVEAQYKAGIDKMVKLYSMEGDRKSKADAEAKRIESTQKLRLLDQALKRYEQLNVGLIDGADGGDDDSLNIPNQRKTLTGQVSIQVHAVADLEHAPTSRYRGNPETYVVITCEDHPTPMSTRPAPSKDDPKRGLKAGQFSDEAFRFDVDKANEIEITVYDRAGHQTTPVGILWFRIADLAEEVRRKKIEIELNQSGWRRADQLQPDLQFQPPPSQGHGGAGAPGPGAMQPGPSGPSAVAPAPSITNWYSLEPVGRIQLTFSFVKHTKNKQPFDLRLGRKGAIRQRKEDVHEQYGHKFVQQQFYNIMRCALCGDFLKYGTGMQCSDCRYTCHKKCYTKVVTKCITQSNAETDPDEAKLNHRIPHRFENTTIMGAYWCCHCGYLLPLGRNKGKQCKECSLYCHAGCVHFVPDFCGMSMEKANQILMEIKRTRRGQSASGTTMTSRVLRPQGAQKPTPPPPTQPQFLPPPGQEQQGQPERYSYGKDQPYGAAPGQPPYSPSATSVDAARSSYRTSGSGPAPASPTSQRPPSNRSQTSQTTPAASVAAAAAVMGKGPAPPYQRAQSDYSPPGSRTSGGYPQDQRVAQQQPPPQVGYDPRLYANVSNTPYPPTHHQTPSHGAQQYYPPPPAQASPQKQVPLGQPPQPMPEMEQHAPPVSQPLSAMTKAPENKVTPAADTKGTGRRIGLDHFNFLAVLGKGNFGKVMLAETKTTKQLYAIKVLKKEFIIENDEVESTRSEKRVFLIANKERHPFLLNLHACFQTETRVYFVMEYISGGDLMLHIQRGQFGLKRAQFYAAEVCLALKYFHENGVIYRDLKLDNILLTLDGHIKIGDYGLCKEDMWYGSTTSTFCGTPEFMAPEILLDKKYGRAVDWWAFGVLIYQMLLQQSPFRGEDEDEIYDAILADEPLYPIHMPRDSVSILQKLLTREPERRLGSGPTDAQEIMSHPFFRNINWDDVYHKRIPAPFIPQISNPTDTSNFDTEFTSVTPVLTPVQSVLSQAMQEEFRGFSYSADFV
ncbi:uncharacterized protein EI97DRAFT_178538 [Westerdykella ornata]|uniref:protein kinase C n=1 Tax=Westerdykella ornata TaxID=318751 RepID=A0A6A6JTS5_WESOR|nr:uncharacterized protein EI97DRAFT_178538 [Westerdykella ornata]KAF2279503.1 hypothetical protein EI97DRAFT_178538 [Westerdykella ornata]